MLNVFSKSLNSLNLLNLLKISFVFFCFMSELKIGSLNLNLARDERKRASCFRLCSLKKKIVQETLSTADNEVDWEGDVFLSHKTSNSCGVGSKVFNPQSVECEEVIKG